MDIESTLTKLENMPYSQTKETLTENMFYITVWNKLDTNQRVRLLQILENNLSYRDGRPASRVELYPKLPSLTQASEATRKIKISDWHLTSNFNELNNLNAQLYCAICHEHEHISQFVDVDSDKNDKKTEECRTNMKFVIPHSSTNVQGYIEYRLQPLEYYAHKISEEQTVATFTRLEREFGEDEGFQEWSKEVLSISVDDLVRIYNQEYYTTYTFDELYASILDKIKEKSPKTK